MNHFLRLTRAVVVFAICCCCLSINAQNLVLNPSFEITSGCPQGISQFNLATDWEEGNTGADSCTTSDLYAPCSSTIGGANSPNGLLGYQPSRTGTNHAGFILGEGFLGCTLIGDNYREYVEGHTSSPLVAGQKYLVRFYVSLPEGVMGGTDDIGLYFSNSYYSRNACPNNQRITVTPQLNYCGAPIMDTLNWVEVKWIYTATGGESYFTIGNFKADNNTTVSPLNCASFNPYLYYYIDDVEISPLPVNTNECAFALTTTTTNAGCPNNDGTATVKAAGCTSPFTYRWSNLSQAATITGMPAGTYAVTVSDNTNCSSTINAVINAYTPPILQVSTINASCTGTDGSVIASVVTGTGPYTYQWSNNVNTQVASNLGAGTYTVTVTGAGQCSATAAGVITASSGALNLAGSFTAATCGNNNGTATVNVTGSNGPFTYSWSNSQTSQTISNLTPGTYTVTVSSSSSGAITPFFSENFTNGSTGWTFANGPGTNGANPNQWVVNNNTDCICHTGNYLHVTCNNTALPCFGNAGGCTYFTGTPISNPLFGDPTADICAISPTISTLGKSNMVLKFKYESGGDANIDYGLVRFSSNGGTNWTDMPTRYSDSTTCTYAFVNVPSNFDNTANFKFAFRWINNNDGNGNDPGFAIDSIELIENTSAGCPAVTAVVVPSSTALSLTATAVNASCGQNNGSATVAVAGGGNYTYAWSNNGATPTISNIGGGTYTVTVTQGGCSATASAVVAATGTPVISTSATSAGCTGNTGTATVTVTSGTATGYSWSSGATTATASNLAPGAYTVTVTGAGGCTVTASANVIATGTPVISVASTNTGCSTTTGTATVTVTSGTAIGYNWSSGATTATASNLGPGSYTVTVTGTGGCTATASTAVSVAATPVISTSTTSATCNGSTGSATVNVTSGTATGYNWSSGANTATASNLPAGTYTVTVTGNGGCSATASAIVTAPGTPVVNTSTTSAGCTGNTGSATVTVSSGTATGYSWSSGASTATASNLAAGSYTVTVTGTGGCTVTASAVVTTISAPVVTTTATNAGCNSSTGSATVTVTSGSATGYLWSSGATTATAPNLAAGTYTVTVTGTGNCTITASATVNATGGVAISATSTNTSCGAANGTATVNVTSGAAASYSWSGGAGTTASVTGLSSGTYTVTVSDAGGCSATASVTVGGSGANSVIITSSDTSICSSDTAHICAPSGYTSYLWNTGATTECIATRQAGNYYLTVTDNGNCTATSNRIAINVLPQPPVSISVNGDSLLAYNAASYQWYLNGTILPGATNPLLVATQTGSYTVLVTGANGCSALSLPVVISVTGLNEVTSDNFKIYPNPNSTGSWNLAVDKPWINGQYEIFDVEGRLLAKSNIQSELSEINISVASGVYVIRLSSGTKNASFKLIKL